MRARFSWILVAAGLSLVACGNAESPQGSSNAGGNAGGAGAAGGAGDLGGGGSGAGANGGGGGTSAGDAAMAAFVDAFEDQRYDELPDLVADLDAAAELEPERADVALHAGLSRLWRLSEWGRDPTQDPSEIPGIALGTRAALEKTRELAPDDHRVLGWLGPTKIAIGSFLGDAALVDEGFADVDAGVAAHPEFNLFVKALVREGAPRDSADFQDAVEAMWATLDVCVGEPVDRENPDYSGYMDLETTEGPARTCWNTGKARHNFEGFFLYFGDMLVKAGDPDLAAAIYENAKLSSTYDTWPSKDVLDARIADAPSRAALYADADPANDPELVGVGSRQCATCHAR
jgi:hypothetical protein